MDSPAHFAALVAGVALLTAPFVAKVVDWVKYITARNWNAVLTQVVVWAAGIGFTGLFALSNFSTEAGLTGLDTASVILVGLSAGSVASVGFDNLKARDRTQSAGKPDLLPPPKRRKALKAKPKA